MSVFVCACGGGEDESNADSNVDVHSTSVCMVKQTPPGQPPQPLPPDCSGKK